MSQTLLRVCGYCHNDFEPKRSTQICCSPECGYERKKIADRLKQKENKKKQVFVISFPCMYPKCSTMVQRGGQVTNRKYCDVHARAKFLETRRKANAKSYAKYRQVLCCKYCGAKLGKWKRKYCSEKHAIRHKQVQKRKIKLRAIIFNYKKRIKGFERELQSL